jgi:hypothetical protein
MFHTLLQAKMTIRVGIIMEHLCPEILAGLVKCGAGGKNDPILMDAAVNIGHRGWSVAA